VSRRSRASGNMSWASPPVKHWLRPAGNFRGLVALARAGSCL
jgi:hypothetical protein